MPYDYSVDVWSVGVLLYEMICSQKGMRMDNSNLIDLAKSEKNLTFPQGVSQECADLIAKLLKYDHSKRLTIKEIFEHPWTKKQAADSQINVQGLLKQNVDFVSMDESMSLIRSKYRKSCLAGEMPSTAAQTQFKGRFSEYGYHPLEKVSSREIPSRDEPRFSH